MPLPSRDPTDPSSTPQRGAGLFLLVIGALLALAVLYGIFTR